MVTVDTRQLAKMTRALAHIKNGVPKAMSPAINRAIAKGRTEVKREIRKEYLIKAKDIPIKTQMANRSSLKGGIEVTQGMLGLDKFQLRPRMGSGRPRRMIYARVKKGGGGLLPGAFFIPSGGPYGRIGPSRFPIYKMATISAAIMASQPTVGPAINKAMGK
jgi:hypothetical protein